MGRKKTQSTAPPAADLAVAAKKPRPIRRIRSQRFACYIPRLTKRHGFLPVHYDATEIVNNIIRRLPVLVFERARSLLQGTQQTITQAHMYDAIRSICVEYDIKPSVQARVIEHAKCAVAALAAHDAAGEPKKGGEENRNEPQ